MPSAQVLRSLLSPKSVAVVGASDSRFTFSGAPLHNLSVHGFTGSVYPVNPKRDEIGGQECYPSVLDIPEAVETAVITVPAAAVVDVLEQCERRGVLSATVVSAGFGEDGAGPDGQVRQRRLDEWLSGSRLRVLGPNTAGLINLLDDYVPRAAANHLEGSRLRAGSVALFTQSGACSNIVFNRAQANGVGIGVMAATGGECDITVWDLVEHSLHDERVSVVMVVIEALGDPQRIRKVAALAHSLRKPVVLLKLGSSPLGSEVVMTHSGSIAGDEQVARAAFEQWGIVQVDDFDALWQVARLFEAWGAPTGPTGRLGVFAFSGGEAALIADHASDTSLSLPAVSEAFDQNIREVLGFAKAANPFDATGELVGRPEKLVPVLNSFLDDNELTEVLVATPVYRAEAAERVLPQLETLFRDRGDSGPRVAFSMWPAGPLTELQAELLSATGCPVLPDSTRAVHAIDRYSGWLSGLDKPRAAPETAASLSATVPAPRLGATYAEVRDCLRELGMPFAPGGHTTSADEAVAMAREIGFPVVMKGDVSSTMHKAKAGLVAVGVATEDAVRARYSELAALAAAHGGQGVVVEAMVSASLQCFVGARRDPDFGTTLIFGLGGSAAEFLDDTALLVVDEEADVGELLLGTRVGSFIQEEYPKVAMSLTEMLAATAAWFTAEPAVEDVDLNPVMVDVTSGTVTCVDGRVLVREA
ncbi:acetate--CoA ligase family protein [Nocardioides gansuensis]|uniref:acetate--CoA ligase family protein n=1 Tax=Nocardioides gansuensis TaxID=2138300 RepID=UPI001403C28B|nr:acetate--CoA ligase family protein [Nocardioides gansuensis]